MPTIPKIWFVKKDDAGSAELRANQVSLALRNRGLDAAAVKEVGAEQKNGVVVFVKHLEYDESILAAEQGNIVVYDLVDKFTFHDFSRYDPSDVRRYFSLVDSAIHPNGYSLRNFAGYFPEGCLNTVIHHHWDARFSASLERVRAMAPYRFRLGYIGDPDNFRPAPEAIAPVFEFERQLEFCPLFTCHYTAREEGSPGALIKPGTKISIAASVDSNVVTTRDESALELLGPDYPFLAPWDDRGIAETIAYARQSFGGADWLRGLEIMRELKESTSLNAVIDGGYMGLFREILN